MVDDVRVIQQIAQATSSKTRGQAKRRRVEVAPKCLERRVDRGEALPQVEIKGDGGETLRAVLSFVVHSFKSELMVEFSKMLM